MTESVWSDTFLKSEPQPAEQLTNPLVIPENPPSQVLQTDSVTGGTARWLMEEEGVRAIRYVCHTSTSCRSLLFPTCLFGQTHYFIYASTPLTLITLHLDIFFWDLQLQEAMDQKRIVLHSSRLVGNVKSIKVNLRTALCSVLSPAACGSWVWRGGSAISLFEWCAFPLAVVTGCGDMLMKEIKERECFTQLKKQILIHSVWSTCWVRRRGLVLTLV